MRITDRNMIATYSFEDVYFGVIDKIIYKLLRWIFFKLLPLFDVGGTFYQDLTPLIKQKELDESIVAENMEFMNDTGYQCY